MADSNSISMAKKIGAADFNPERYVKELSQQCVGGQELQQQRQKIQALADETSGLLKKNVYQNYMQFIETAKEISHLESEMYQLSHLLTEQRLLLEALRGDSAPSLAAPPEAPPDQEDERRRHLAAILEKVEGCVGLLDVPGRALLHDGDLLELEPVDNTAMQRVHAYLLNDGLMLASWISSRSGPMRYKYQALYPLASLAVVNVRDSENAIKLLAFPHTRIFQCVNAASKREWLDKCVEAKQPKREVTERSPTRQSSESIDSYNPFEDNTTAVPQLPEWLVEVPDDLDVCMAQRHFEEAFTMVERAREYLEQAPKPDPMLDDIRHKVNDRVRCLTDVLMKELEVSPDKSLQGGLRAARRAVRLLNQLDRSTQACELFLKLCSSILKAQLKRVKREGNTVLYVRQIGGIFFSSLADMAKEFLRAFPSSPSCASAFVVWSGSELSHMTSHLIKQVFMPQSSTTTLAECVSTLRDQCSQLCSLGVDLRYQLDGLLRSPLSHALSDTRDKMVDAVKLRAAEDRWRPLNLQSRAGLAKLAQELTDLGLTAPLQTYLTGDCWLELTGNTIAFVKLYLTLLDDCLRLATADLVHTIDEVLIGVFTAQLRHIELSRSNDKLRTESKLIEKNAVFLLDTVLPLALQTYERRMEFSCSRLKDLASKRAKAKPITKYSSSEYL